MIKEFLTQTSEKIKDLLFKSQSSDSPIKNLPDPEDINNQIKNYILKEKGLERVKDLFEIKYIFFLLFKNIIVYKPCLRPRISEM